MPSCHCAFSVINKIITVSICVFIMVVSVITLITLGGFNLYRIFLAIYWMIFSMMLILAEFKVRFILSWFRLLAYQFGKALFCIIIGLLMLQSKQKTLQFVGAMCLFGLGLYDVIIYFVAVKNNDQETVSGYTEFNA